MPPGALLIHGFTATPECLDSLKVPLEKEGFVVETPLLAGHGTTARALRKTTRQDWYQSVLAAYRSLASRTESVCVAGLSLGGLLALQLASEFPVKRLALLATPIFFEGFLMKRLLPFIVNGPLGRLYAYQPKLLGPAINDPAGRRAFKSNFFMPLKSVMEIVRLQDELRPKLQRVTAPTLIVHSPRDNTAPYASLEYLKKDLAAKTIRTVTLKESNHVLTLDYEKDQVAREVVKFFKEGKGSLPPRRVGAIES